MKSYLLTLNIVFFFIVSNAQINNYGTPFISNYDSKIYKASEQNWAVAQATSGIMYFGNNDEGLLEFDGVNWRKINIKNNSIVRSLATDTNGNIFVGAVGEIGIVTPNGNGKLVYQSFNNLIDTNCLEYSDVWKTYFNNDTVWFCSREYVFEYSNNNINAVRLSQSAFFSFYEDNKLLIGDFTEGLKIKDKQIIKPVEGGGNFSNIGIYTLNSIDSGYLLGTFDNGLYVFTDGAIDKQHSFNESEINRFLTNNQLYQSYQSENEYAFGTLQNGIVFCDTNGEITGHLNKKLGLKDETITHITTDITGNYWLTLNNGISKIEKGSNITRFNEAHGLEGAVLDICTFNNTIFVASSFGVYYKEINKNGYAEFRKLKGIDKAASSLLEYKKNGEYQLLVGTSYGLYSVSSDLSIKYIDIKLTKDENENWTSYVNKLYCDKTSSNNVFVGLSNGLFSMDYKNGKWQLYKEYNVNKNDIKSISVSANGDLWVSTYFDGLMKFSASSDSIKTEYTKKHGLPSLKEILISKIDNELVFATEGGLMQFNESDNQFVPYTKFGMSFNQSDSKIGPLSIDNDGNIWIPLKSGRDNYFYKIDTQNNYIDSVSFKRLPNTQIDVVFTKNNGDIYLGSFEGMFYINNSQIFNYAITYNTLIRKVLLNNDSLVFEGCNFEVVDAKIIPKSGPTHQQLNRLIEYKLNDLSFEFAAPYFIEENQTQYSYKLEGYDNDWSKWSIETKANYTNLNEGNYIFNAKAKNIYGIESSVAEYKFSIAPPWYRTIIAYIIYCILGILLIILILKLYTRRLEREKIRLEGIVHERTAEIRKQNEKLEEQKDEILEQKEEITSSIHYAQRIQKAIVPTKDLAANLLNDYFLLWKPRDIVSGDYWWLGEKNGCIIVTAADCTGHGVPGAFMSMLGVSFLNEIVKQQNITNSNEILDKMRDKVKTTLGQTGEANTSKDGMDMALLVLDLNNMKAQFSGAYNPLYLYRNSELIETKADRNPIAVYIKEKPFTQHTFELQKGDTMYMFSDGFPDQFGGEKDKKYSTKRFKKLLLDIQSKSMVEQKQILDKEIEEWRGDVSQIDDIIVLGIRV